MNGHDDFEAELSRLKPAAPPTEFLVRLQKVQPLATPARSVISPRPNFVSRVFALRWLVPAAALAIFGLLVWRIILPSPPASHDQRPVAAAPTLKADEVQIDRELVATYEAVARLPGGEPVRLRCREWVDQVVWEDKARGLVVEQRTPRIELIPVRFETY